MTSTSAVGPPAADPQRAFDEWLHAPLIEEDLPPPHSGVEVRRARLEDFAELRGIVEKAFGERRSPAVFDWLYRRTPRGPARPWVCEERSSGRLVSTAAAIPWPMARGADGVEGALLVDGAVLPEWQRTGLFRQWSLVRAAHPWSRSVVALEWPNAKTRSALARRGLGPEPGGTLLFPEDVAPAAYGTLSRAMLPLDVGTLLREHGVPRPAAALATASASAFLRATRRLALRGAGRLSVEPVAHFDSAFDALTLRCMATSDLWTSHDATFLNWRYLAHPEHEYRALAVVEGDAPLAYGVLRLAGEAAWLMELAAPVERRGPAAALLTALIDAARAAGCRRIDFFGARNFRHWSLLRRAGFLARPADVWLGVMGPWLGEAQRLDRWQVLPSDTENI